MFTKKLVFERYAAVFQAFASAPRIELLELLFQGERSVEKLAEEASLSVANASQHLKVLRQARLVRSRKEGLRVIYSLSNEDVYPVWEAFRSFGEKRILDIQDVLRGFLEGRDELEAVTAEELQRKVDRGEVIVIDVRPAEEYEAGHIPGAESIPIQELERRIKELPSEKGIVAYCRGPYCLQSDDAVRILKAAGFDASRLEVGLPEWRAANLPVELGKGAKA